MTVHALAHTHADLVLAYLQGNIPGHVDVTLVLVHPDLGHPQSVAPHVGRQVLRVGFVGALDVCDPGARQHLHAAATLPDLPGRGRRHSSWTVAQDKAPVYCMGPLDRRR